MIEKYRESPAGGPFATQKACGQARRKDIPAHQLDTGGGGVAEILQRMIPIMSSLGINARWEVIKGDERFFDMTKKVHNALQGTPEKIDQDMWEHHRAVSEMNAAVLDLQADATVIHDPSRSLS